MLDRFDAGFDREGLLFLTVDTRGVADNEEGNAAIVEELASRLRSVPGVERVSYAGYAPLSWRNMSLGFVQAEGSSETARVDFNVVGPDYLSVLGSPVQLGRDVAVADRRGGVSVAVVNENLARTLWPGQSPLGRTIRVLESDESLEVVGVAANASFSDIRQGAAVNMVFLPFQQRSQQAGDLVLHVRHAGSLSLLMPAVRSVVSQYNPDLPIVNAEPAEERLQSSFPAKYLSVLILGFATGALLLAALGLYGLVAVSMARRTREFAIRSAVGASSSRIWIEAMRGGLVLIAFGLASGLTLGFFASRSLEAILFGVGSTDAVTYASVATIVTFACLAACALPAARATRTDPAAVLRQE
jgi:ABC-type antimicrobial peptide transport system permease subunit